MGAKTELFPTFPELCATAREVEKKPLSIPPRPIDGKLVLDENFGIFPREFEEYTYSFLLFEAQKIERRLDVDAIASSQPEPVAAPLHFTPEQQMENDLHRFVSAQEQESLDNEEDRLLKSLREKKAPAQPKPDEVADYERDHLLPRETDDEAPLPDEDSTPSPPPVKKEETPAWPPAKPRVLPPKIEQKKTSSMPGAPQIPSAKPPAQSAPQIPLAKLPVRPAQMAPAAKPDEQDAYEPAYPVRRQPSSPIMPEPASSAEAEAEKKPPAGISSYSKLSPRLQALIDAKLRREDEKAKKARADSDIFKTPLPPQPEDEPEGGEPGKELENVDAPNAWNLHDEEEEKDVEPDARAKGNKKPISGQDEIEREEILLEPSGKSQRKMPLRKTEDEIAPIPDEKEQPSLQEEPEAPAPDEEEAEQEMPPTNQPSRKEKSPIAKREAPDDAPSEEEEEKQALLQDAPEKEEPLPRARSIAQSGPFTIKPMFPDASPSGTLQEKQEISQAEDSDRMRRIQRIIEDLSPDKVRAQPKQEEISFEKEDGEDEKEHEEEEIKEAEPEQQKEIPLPLKKPAGAQKKQAAAAQEKIAPSIKQRGAPAKKPQSKAPAKEEPEEIPVAKKVAPKPPVREEPEEEESQEPEEKIPSVSAPRKFSPRAPVREEQEEEEVQAPAKPMRRLMPKIPARQEEDEAPEEEREEAPLPKKLKPRLPMREEESEETDEQPAQVSPLRRRILPGMARTAPSTPQTYVPPARERKRVALPPQEPEEREMQEQQEDEAPEPEQEETSPRLAPLKPKKLVSDETLEAQEKTPEQLQQEEKMAKMAKQLARLEAGRVKEVAGTAALPVDEEDIPLPDDDEGVPKPKEYEQAKEMLRKSLEHEETARKVKQEDEVIVEQYAKDHLVWLYEIYKMGGMAREDFLQKASEKYSEAQNASPSPTGGSDKDAPPNPALAALSKEIEKKDKK